jgi:ABC-2 type transport system permease protein
MSPFTQLQPTEAVAGGGAVTGAVADAVAGPRATPASRSDDQAPRRRGSLALVAHQVRFDLLSFARNRQARFYTFAMPVLFLVLFVAIFGNEFLSRGSHVHMSTYYVANLTAFGIVDAAFMSLAIGLVDARETGVLRRRQATPLAPWMVVVGRAVTGLLGSLVMGSLLLGIGRIVYGASVPLHALPALALAVAVGSVSGCALGFAATRLVRSSQAAQPVLMAVSLPLFFISGIFVPWLIIPHWLRQVAEVFPVRHLALSILTPFTSPGAPWSWGDLTVVAAWGVGGLLLAVRRFYWGPREA